MSEIGKKLHFAEKILRGYYENEGETEDVIVDVETCIYMSRFLLAKIEDLEDQIKELKS